MGVLIMKYLKQKNDIKKSNRVKNMQKAYSWIYDIFLFVSKSKKILLCDDMTMCDFVWVHQQCLIKGNSQYEILNSDYRHSINVFVKITFRERAKTR